MQKLKTKNCGLKLDDTWASVSNQEPTDTHRPAFTRHLPGRVHRCAVGGRTTTFLDPCNSSRAPLSHSTSTTYGGGGGVGGTHYFFLFPLSRQCLIHLLRLWNFTHDIKIIKCWPEHWLRPHPVSSDTLFTYQRLRGGLSQWFSSLTTHKNHWRRLWCIQIPRPHPQNLPPSRTR